MLFKYKRYSQKNYFSIWLKMKPIQSCLFLLFSILTAFSAGQYYFGTVTPTCENCCLCPQTYGISTPPVCASNGKVYNNICLFRCASRYFASMQISVAAMDMSYCRNLQFPWYGTNLQQGWSATYPMYRQTSFDDDESTH